MHAADSARSGGWWTVLLAFVPCLVIFGVGIPVVFGLLPQPWQSIGEWTFAAVGVAALIFGLRQVVLVMGDRAPAPLEDEPFRWWWVPTYGVWLSHMFSSGSGEAVAMRIAEAAFGVWLLLLGFAVLVTRMRSRAGQALDRAGDVSS